MVTQRVKGDKVYEALDPDADLQGTTKDNATADATSVSPSNPSPPSSADDGAKAKDILDKNPDHTTTETSGENMMPGGFLIKGIDKTLDFASNALGDALTVRLNYNPWMIANDESSLATERSKMPKSWKMPTRYSRQCITVSIPLIHTSSLYPVSNRTLNPTQWCIKASTLAKVWWQGA